MNDKLNLRLMTQDFSNPKAFKSIEVTAIEKISSLITRFHAALLTKANDSGVFRDLSQEEQYLLANLDSENHLHSILAGCLAIDSCLSSISQSEQDLTDNILKSVTALCSTWQNIQNDLIDCIQSNTLTVHKVELLWKQVEVNTKNLLSYCHDLPYGQQNDEIKKQQKIMSQQDITFKSGDLKLLDKLEDEQIRQLHRENQKLREQLAISQKKAAHLQLKLSNQDQYKQSKERPQTHRKYSQNDIEGRDDLHPYNNKWPHFNSPSSTNTGYEREIQTLRQQVTLYQNTISKMKEQFNREKKRMLREIRRLQDDLRISQLNHDDNELLQMLERLQEEVETLREERKHDERIIEQIQHKLCGMSITNASRIKENTRRQKQSRIKLKYSNIFKSKNDYDEDISQIQSRSPSFKKSLVRNRFYTTNNEGVSKSTISIPRTNQEYSAHKDIYSWKESKTPKQGRDRYSKQQIGSQGLKYTRIMPGEDQLTHQSYGRKGNSQKQQKIVMRGDFNSIPMIQSKLNNEDYRTPNEKITYHGQSKRLSNENRKYILPQDAINIKPQYRYDDNRQIPKAGKRLKYNQDAQRQIHERLENRYKTTRD